MMHVPAYPSPGSSKASASGFGSIGRISRLVTSLLGGALFGSTFGLLAGVAGGALGLLFFALSERSQSK